MPTGENQYGPRKKGRPHKYLPILEALDDDEIYTGGKIARFALEHGFFDKEADTKLAQQRVRTAMTRMARNHEFPEQGDGLVTLRGQKPAPGWTGRRWKLATLPEFFEILAQDKLYSPGQIVNMTRRRGYFGPPNPEVSYQRLMMTLVRTIKVLKFPPEGDGLITPDGQAPFPGWFGWRWRSAYYSPHRPRGLDGHHLKRGENDQD